MSELEIGGQYVEKVSQTDKEARHRRAVAKIAEPLLEGLQPGTHHFTPEQFRALAQYIFESEPHKIARALKCDRFKLLALEFVCTRAKGETMTLSEFARARGATRRTLLDRAAKAQIKSVQLGGKKLFYVEELDRLLAEASG